MREKLAYAMVRAPMFDPEEGQTEENVLLELRKRLDNVRTEWWGGDVLYARMGEHLEQAKLALERFETIEAKRAFGEIYAIIDQTPRPK